MVEIKLRLLILTLGNILDTAKLESKKLELSVNTSNLKETLHHVVKMNEKRAFDKNIKIQLIDGKAIPKFVYMDQGRVIQVLMNLVGNSVKFTSTGCVYIKVDWVEIDHPKPFEIDGLAQQNDRHQVLETIAGRLPSHLHLNRND